MLVSPDGGLYSKEDALQFQHALLTEGIAAMKVENCLFWQPSMENRCYDIQ